MDHHTGSRPRCTGVLQVPTKAGSEKDRKDEKGERAVEIARHEVELDSTMAKIRIDWKWLASCWKGLLGGVSRNCGSLSSGQNRDKTTDWWSLLLGFADGKASR